MTKLLITCHHLIRHIDKYAPMLNNKGIRFKIAKTDKQQFTASEIYDLLPGFDFIIAGDDEINDEAINFSSKSGLKAIIKWGIGVDNIDIEAARKYKVPVFNTPNVFGGEVAEQAMSFILNLARGTHLIDSNVRKGIWDKREGSSLHNKKIGIIGFGSIGQEIAKRAIAFDMKVLRYDPFYKSKSSNELFKEVSFDMICQDSDYLVLACALNKDNRHMIDDTALNKMKSSSFVINVSRGGLINEASLIDALSKGIIKGAALDVFEVEPLSLKSKLHDIPNCIFGSHNSSNTIEAVERVNKMTIDMVLEASIKNIFDIYPEKRIT